jgi:hypothetical protein
MRRSITQQSANADAPDVFKPRVLFVHSLHVSAGVPYVRDRRREVFKSSSQTRFSARVLGTAGCLGRMRGG